MIYVIGKNSVEGLNDLCQKIGAMRVRKFDGLNFWVSRQHLQLNPGDIIIPWGVSIPELEGVDVLNPAIPEAKNDLKLIKMIGSKGIYTTGVYAPTSEMPGRIGAIGRKFGHSGGDDLINPPSNPDYYTQKHAFAKEYVVHIFSGKPILSGVKVPIEGFCLRTTQGYPCAICNPTSPTVLDGPCHGPHPWIRVPSMGWKVDYSNKISNTAKNTAISAAAVLGGLFSVVTIGYTGEGITMVIGVSQTPHLSPQVLYVYSRALSGYLSRQAEGVQNHFVDVPF